MAALAGATKMPQYLQRSNPEAHPEARALQAIGFLSSVFNLPSEFPLPGGRGRERLKLNVFSDP